MKKIIHIIIGSLVVFIVCIGCQKNETTKEYTVIFNTNGGSDVASQKINEGQAIIKPLDPIREGYIFKEWTYEGQTFDFTVNITRDMTLTAVWEEVISSETKKYTITFDSDGGTHVPNQIVEENGTIRDFDDPIKIDYIFIGWFINNEEFDLTTKITSDITLIAHYKKVDKIKTSYTVTFNTNGGSKVKTQIVQEGNKVAKPKNPVRPGYEFINWTLNGKLYNFNNNVVKDITLIANWKKKEQPVQPEQIDTPTLKIVYGEETAQKPELVDGKYGYDLGIDKSVYRPDQDKYNNYTVTGYEVYEKKGTDYILVKDELMTGSEVVYVEIQPGEKKEYVTRVYAKNTKGVKQYSEYSNIITIDHSKIDTPTLKIVYGEETAQKPELVDGKYGYDLGIDKSAYRPDKDKYNNYTVTGYEVYEKKGTDYILIKDELMTGSEVVYVEIQPGEKKEYVARVYAKNTKGVKQYSEYSNIITIDHLNA